MYFPSPLSYTGLQSFVLVIRKGLEALSDFHVFEKPYIIRRGAQNPYMCEFRESICQFYINSHLHGISH